MTKALGTLLAALALVGMPLFAVLGGISILSWLTTEDPQKRFVRNVVANVLDAKFADGKIIITIPLFIFVGYLMAESNTPKRMVNAASAALGWLPGGLAIVCIFASAFFTTLTGGSGVTIVAIGGLLYPALIQQGYPKSFSLGLVTTAGALGLLFPPSPLVLIYGFVSGVEIDRAYIATMPPGGLLVLVLCAYAAFVGRRSKVPTQPFQLSEVFRGLWLVKWELLAPVLVLAGLLTALMDLHESAAAAVLYTLIIEIYIYKDLTWKKVIRIAREAMSLAGAIIVILAMATALTNYIVDQKIPQSMLDWFIAKGMSEPWQFIIVLNIFLFILGMLMDAFSALLVALPLLIPLAAAFGLHPFYLAVMFLLNLEIAYVTPPVGLNLYIASFRFRRPVVEIYRVVLPFVGLLTLGLLVIILWPGLSSFTVESEVARRRAEAARCGCKLASEVKSPEEKAEAENCEKRCLKPGNAPTEAWKLECIQEDHNNPLPCLEGDIELWGKDGRKQMRLAAAKSAESVELDPEEEKLSVETEKDLLDELMGDDDDDDKGKDKDDDKDDDDEDDGAGGKAGQLGKDAGGKDAGGKDAGGKDAGGKDAGGKGKPSGTGGADDKGGTGGDDLDIRL